MNVLVTAVIGVACGQKTFTAIADFVSGQHDWFGRLLDLSNGTPSEDTCCPVFEAVDPEAFERCFTQWVSGIAELFPEGETVAIDGKTIRNSGLKSARPLHLAAV